jgi:tRNA threonylcarbamoyl adenosine modification protein YjeE
VWYVGTSTHQADQVDTKVQDAAGMWQLGADLAELLKAGDVVALSGPLGAGKTTLVQGLAAGLGIADQVTSPTFVVERRYRPGQRGIGLVHVDAYRLAGLQELRDLELDDQPSDIVVVEWGAPYLAALVSVWVDVVIQRDELPLDSDSDPAGGVRDVHIRWHGQEART